MIKKTYKKSTWDKYKEVNGILYYTGRLGEEAELVQRDLDCQVFLMLLNFLVAYL